MSDVKLKNSIRHCLCRIPEQKHSGSQLRPPDTLDHPHLLSSCTGQAAWFRCVYGPLLKALRRYSGMHPRHDGASRRQNRSRLFTAVDKRFYYLCIMFVCSPTPLNFKNLEGRDCVCQVFLFPHIPKTGLRTHGVHQIATVCTVCHQREP